ASERAASRRALGPRDGVPTGSVIGLTGRLGAQAGSRVPAQNSVAALFEDAFTDPHLLIRPAGVENVFLVPGSWALQRHDTPCPDRAGHRQLALRHFLRPLGPDFAEAP